jgi:signal transduction histidine kinase/ligand-binding sensor domain-containing protein
VPVSRWRIVAFALALLWAPLAFALNPSRQITQYGHNAWRMQEGFVGPANAVAQTPDGYLWIATNMGLIRFDGVRFVPWADLPGQPLPDSRVNMLFTARDGSLWIGMQNGIARLKDGALTNFDVRGQIDSIIEDEGTIWIARAHLAVGDRDSPICSYSGEQFHCYKDTGMPFNWATAIARADDGYLWIGSTAGICRWKPGHLATCDLPDALASAGGGLGVSDVMPTNNGLLVGIARTGPGLGLEEYIDGAWHAFSATGAASLDLDVSALLRDRDGGIWVATSSKGLYRLYQGRADHFGSADGLSSDTVASLYEDAEGTIWAATSKGLDSLRELHVTSFSKREGLSADLVDSVVADDDGNIWIGNDGALEVLRANTVKAIKTKDGLPGQRVTSMLKDRAGQLWVGTDDRLSIYEHGRFSPVTMTDGAPLGTIWRLAEDNERNVWAIVVGGARQQLLRIRDRSVQEVIDAAAIAEPNSLAADPAGGLWLGHGNGKLAHSRHAGFEEMPQPDGRSAVFTSLLADSSNSVWAASIGGIVRWKDGMQKRLSAANGLPCSYVFAAVTDTRNSLWLSTACGIIAISESEVDRWWSDPGTHVKFRVFDALDGAVPYNADFQPKAVRSPDGRLWFATGGVLQMVDPARTEKQRPPPLVRIENVTADRKDFQPAANLRLPALSRDIHIDYTALSFIAPQKIMFKYRLEGHDDAWEDAGSRRQAFYTNLRPGNYEFRVTAANSDGVWAGSDATLAFVIPPVFYQTDWFLALCLLATAGLACLAYFARVHHVSVRIEDRLEARASERERIARDLHDTLLQSTQALILDFQAEADRIAKDDPLRRRLEAVLDRADKSLADARDVVVELRAPMETTDDLPHALAMAVEELGQRDAAAVSTFVEGERRPLRADVRDEAYRIGREALLNAIQHAQATAIEIQLAYDTARFILRVRDNGRGIDPKILRTGVRPGHWGIIGMRERARRFGGQLEIWSRPASGTEIELRVPANIAYSTQAARPRGAWLRRLMIGEIGER